jgi:hypothetical protein
VSGRCGIGDGRHREPWWPPVAASWKRTLGICGGWARYPHPGLAHGGLARWRWRWRLRPAAIARGILKRGQTIGPSQQE